MRSYYFKWLVFIYIPSLLESIQVNRDNRRGECCSSLLVSSSGPGLDYQRDRLGVYRSMKDVEVNNRTVYEKVNGDDYIYYWIFDNSGGHNWLISNDFNQEGHGIESPNMEWEINCLINSTACNSTCIENLHQFRAPFSVWTKLHRLGGFYRDTTLRVQCWNETISAGCCNKIRIMSNGIGQQSQPQRLGVYTATNDTQHGRKVYKQDFGGSNYLYYWDWGPNNGANWIVGFNPKRRARGIESANLENATITNICAEKVQTVGPFRAWNRQESSWETDETLRLECFDSEKDCCDRVNLTSVGGASSYYFPNAMGLYAFWTAKNGRSVYKHMENEFYLYYNDWGNLQGTNWMVSRSPDLVTGILVSQNLEFSYPDNVCCTDALKFGPFLVKAEKFGWINDLNFKIECDIFHDESNQRLQDFLDG